ncbi:YraN family protein [uncultured Sunxiuqinia sp.]|uniref:YraN family protein n=1 Tax=uncultured Sunxiuqinia sp. TaxID=1573825 RepID=UPI002AA61522|nr:YraN family protein [uncultured Sunxiuqinia sp.]
MSQQKEIGNKGEAIAQEHLRSLGYQILETNWRAHYYEIDIIAQDKDELVIVEVKTRSNDSYEHPSEAVSNKKIRFLVNAAESYIFEKNSHCDTRFDVISIVFYGQNFELEHIKDAFYPTA